MLSLTLLVVIGLATLCYGYEEVLATPAACAYSTTYTASIFSAPKDGTIVGVKAVYSTGEGMTCDSGCSSARSRWGCPHCGGGRKFMVEMMKVSDAANYVGSTIYPVSSTTGFQSEGSVSCSRGCTQQLYYMTGQDIDADAIYWDGASYEVSTDDEFMMQIAEGCCGVTTQDNVGYVCAHIYFLYADEPDTCEWQLVYEHDETGAAVEGSIDDLIEDVLAGKDVRVMLTASSMVITNPHRVWVDNGNVFLYDQGTPQFYASSSSTPEFVSSAAVFEQLLDTSGQRVVRQRGQNAVDATYSNQVKWWTRG